MTVHEMDEARATTEDILTTIEIAETAFGEVDLEGFELFLTTMDIIVQSPTRTYYASGLTMDNIILLQDHGCIFSSSLIHELAHVYLLQTTGDGDADHSEQWMWLTVGRTKALASLLCN